MVTWFIILKIRLGGFFGRTVLCLATPTVNSPFEGADQRVLGSEYGGAGNQKWDARENRQNQPQNTDDQQSDSAKRL
jgi:hypothetical protein